MLRDWSRGSKIVLAISVVMALVFAALLFHVLSDLANTAAQVGRDSAHD